MLALVRVSFEVMLEVDDGLFKLPTVEVNGELPPGSVVDDVTADWADVDGINHAVEYEDDGFYRIII